MEIKKTVIVFFVIQKMTKGSIKPQKVTVKEAKEKKKKWNRSPS